MTVLSESRAREEICRVGKSLFDRGYVHGTAGNISVRLDASEGGGFLITPTDACLGFLDPARLARLDAEGRQTGGDPASKTMALHACIYAAASEFDPGTRCVIHTHSTHCVALSLQRTTDELLAPVTPYFVMKVGHVPVLDYHRPGDPALAARVGQTIAQYGRRGTPIRAVMLARLGPNVWHDSPSAAMAVLDELEETARLACLCGLGGLGGLDRAGSARLIAPLSTLQIDELRLSFGARW